MSTKKHKGGWPKGKPRGPKAEKAIPKPIEISDVKVTPYPRAGDNKAFEGLLDRVEQIGKKAEVVSQQKEPAEKLPIELTTDDVAEWVTWPFTVWAETQKLPKLNISKDESQSIAEPLTRILNRHGVADMIPPDGLDAAMLLGRLTPLMVERFSVIKSARSTRRDTAGQKQGSQKAQGGAVPQGAPVTKPIEV